MFIRYIKLATLIVGLSNKPSELPAKQYEKYSNFLEETIYCGNVYILISPPHRDEIYRKCT